MIPYTFGMKRKSIKSILFFQKMKKIDFVN